MEQLTEDQARQWARIIRPGPYFYVPLDQEQIIGHQ